MAAGVVHCVRLGRVVSTLRGAEWARVIGGQSDQRDGVWRPAESVFHRDHLVEPAQRRLRSPGHRTPHAALPHSLRRLLLVSSTRQYSSSLTLLSLNRLWRIHSVLWRCWSGGSKGIRPVKTERWVAGMSRARCRLVYGPADATATHCLLLQ